MQIRLTVGTFFLAAAFTIILPFALHAQEATETPPAETPTEVTASVEVTTPVVEETTVSVEETTPVVEVPATTEEATIVQETTTSDSSSTPVESVTTESSIAPLDTLLVDPNASTETSSESQTAAVAETVTPLPTPVLTTDKDDYHPGETATIFGSFFQALQDVFLAIVGQDDAGNTIVTSAWNVTADNNGGFTTQYTLPDTYVPMYLLAANSSTGEFLAQTSFTDSVTGVTITFQNSACNGGAKTSFNLNDTVCSRASVTADSSGANNFILQWVNPSSVVVKSTTFNSVVNGNSYTDTSLASTTGTWTVRACKNSGCSGGNLINNATFSVAGLQNQTITVTTPAPASATYGSSFNVAATASSGLSVAISTTGGCTGSGTGSASITMTSGTTACVVHYNQAGNGSFNAAPEVTNSVTAQKATPNCSVTGYSATFDGASHSATGSCTGIPADGTLSALNLSATTHTNVGTYSDAWTFTSSNPNYNSASGNVNDTISAATATCNISGFSGAYDGSVHGASGTCTGVGGANLSSSVTLGNTYINVPGGSAHWTFSNSNYVGQSGDVAITITARPVTVAPNAGQSNTYGQSDPVLTYDVTSGSLVGSDAFSGSLTRGAGENAGSYVITQGTLALNSNYALTFTPGVKFFINPASLSINAVADMKAYDHTTVSSGTPQVVGLIGSDHVNNLSQSFDSPAAGPRTLIVSGSFVVVDGNGGNNYSVTAHTASGSITAKSLGIVLTADNKVYDATTDTNAHCSLTGVLGTDDVSCVAGSASFADANVGTGKTVHVSGITLSGTDSGNYSVATSGDTTADITKRSVTVTATASQSKTYGDIDPVLTYGVTAGTVVGSDTSSGMLSRVAGENVGSYVITLGSLSLGSNYDLSLTSGTKFFINKRTLTITAQPNIKVYDGTISATTTPSVSGLFGSDSISNLHEVYDNKNVGSGKDLNILAGYTVNDGNNGGNYDIHHVSDHTGVITTLGVTATITADNKTYDGTDSATVSACNLTGVVSGDDVSCSGTNAHFADANAGAGKTVTAEIVLSGDDKNNYSVNSTAQTTADITKANASCSVSGYSGTYDASAHGATGSCSGVGAADLSSGLNLGSSFTNVPGGTAHWTFTGGQNYNDQAGDVGIVINKKSASVTANNKTKTYGDVNPAFDAVVAGTVGSETLNYTLGTSATQFSAVNTYPITVTLGSNPNYDVIPTNGTLTINKRSASVAANNAGKTYGDVNPVFSATVNGTVNGDTLNYTLGTTAGQFSPVGDYPITVTLGVNPNYNVATTSGTLTISKRSASVTANNKTKVYGAVNPVLDASVSGTVNGDILNYGLSTTATTSSPVNTYPIVVTLGSNSNYDVTPTNGTLTITKAVLTVYATTTVSVQYSDPTPNLNSVTYSGFQGTDSSVDLGGPLSCTSPRSVNDPAGTYPITCSGLTSGNYTFSYVAGTLTVVQENAKIDDTTENFYITAGPTITTAAVALKAHLTQEADGASGDITKAKVTFVLSPIGGGSGYTIPNIPVNSSGDALTTQNIAVGEYQISEVISSGNLYWMQNPAGSGTLEVTPGSTDQRVTGGGWIPDSASRNGKDNFGFTVYYNKNGAPKGNFLYMFRGQDGFDYQIKNNSWAKGGLSFTGVDSAFFTGKATLNKIDQLTGLVVSSDGSYSFNVNMKDGGPTKTTDGFAITLLDGNGTTWKQLGTANSLINLGGGNLVVQSK